MAIHASFGCLIYWEIEAIVARYTGLSNLSYITEPGWRIEKRQVVLYRWQRNSDTVFIRLKTAAYNVFLSFPATYYRGRINFYFSTISKGKDDAQCCLGYNFFQQTLFSHSILISITCTSITGCLWRTKGSFSGVSVITRLAN